jgi:RNA-binding protein 5/10
MFYEAISDFFYDPKSKLYYGNKQGAYFHYNSISKVFEEVQKVDGAEETTDALILGTQNSSSATQQQGKKMAISINLKTKALPSSSNPSKKGKKVTVTKPNPVTTAPVITHVPKKHAADMDKWSERQVEKRQDAQAPDPATTDTSTKVAATAKGEPICLLCRRKFPTLEKLQYHEQVSNLHKENLAKQAAAAVDKQHNASSSYVDRAQQRRIMHGPETTASLLLANFQSVVSLGSESQSSTCTNALIKPEDNLGESNIGNKMLQKLGWKAGIALGRLPDVKYNGEIPPSTNSSGNAGSQQAVATTVKQDWERIESMASNGGKGNRPGGGIGSHRYG